MDGWQITDGSKPLNERHGFSCADNVLHRRGFTGCGKTPVLYQGMTSVVP
jgi:hypothetical protein